MASIALPPQTMRIGRVGRTTDRLGIVFSLLIIWLVFDFGRPAHPMNIPLLISIVSVVAWLGQSKKQWAPYSLWFLVLLGVIAVGLPTAPNTFAASWAFRDMAVRVFCVCLPLQAQIDTVRKVRVWAYALLAVAAYVSAWAMTHQGWGPAGGNGHDENYVAAIIGMAVPFAYFSIFHEKRLVSKILLGVVIVLGVGAMGVAQNPSRGGFLGLCAVVAYCLARSPKKMVGISLVGAIGVAFVLLAGPAFWAEIRTTTDTSTGTGDTRLELWKIGIRMWLAHPFFGVGAGNFPWVVGDYQSLEQLAKFGRSLGGSIIAHSMPVEILAELGTAGAVATAMLVGGTWVAVGKVRQAATQRFGQLELDADLAQIQSFAEAIRASILAVLVNGVFLSLAYYSHIWLLVAVGSALPFVLRARLRRAGLDPAVTKARHKAAARGGVVRYFRPGSVRGR